MPEKTLPVELNKTDKKDNTSGQRIIVIGASAGGFEALKKIVKELPADFNAPLFIVWHMSPDIRGILPQVLNRVNSIYAAHAYDREEIKSNRIYVAPPDHYLLIEEGRVRVTHGQKRIASALQLTRFSALQPTPMAAA